MPAQREGAKRIRAEVRSRDRVSKKRSGLRVSAWGKARMPAQREGAKRIRAEVRSRDRVSKKRSGLRVFAWGKARMPAQREVVKRIRAEVRSLFTNFFLFGIIEPNIPKGVIL